MASIIIPVLLCFFLGPGVGQLYNKDYKKGTLMIVASFIILIVAGVWYFKVLKPFLPGDLTTMDPLAAQDLVRNAAAQVSAQNGSILSAFEAILTVIWLYGVVDAFLVAKKKNNGGI